ncbi:hypothetical protein Q4E40_06770 [Pontibacter sp. BT731]|uniref:hypothetical protein n=1 Tax=Pontibacter coccineus TaxID=3063328 RepID=UPI0026E3937D|nr:hypothetical protein [Pontibacter sp. BT731]MDO6389823.1 hypothetical protein [Pontibacter sp. BT731]
MKKESRILVFPLLLLISFAAFLLKYGWEGNYITVLGFIFSIFMTANAIRGILNQFNSEEYRVTDSVLSVKEFKKIAPNRSLIKSEFLFEDRSWSMLSVGLEYHVAVADNKILLRKQIDPETRDLGYLPLFLGVSTNLEKQIRETIKKYSS